MRGPKVPGCGPMDARVFLVGEAPGAEEERKGIPFVGGAGWLLDQTLTQAGLYRPEIRIHNILPFRPPNNDLKRLKEIGVAHPFEFVHELFEEIEQVNPNVVVAAGNLALEALTGKKGIMKWRGSILEGPNGRKVIPVIHPAMILRAYEWRPILVHDLRRVAEDQYFPELKLPERTLIHSPSAHQAGVELTRLIHTSHLSVDIELMRGHVACYGFSDSPNFAICIPFDTGISSYWDSPVDEEEMLQLCCKALQGESLKIIQNALFELTFLGGYKGVRNVWRDTMVVSHLLYPEFRKGLDFLTSIYTREPYYKDEGRTWRPGVDDPSQMYLYNCKDAAVTFEIAQKQEKELEELGLKEFYEEYQAPLTRVLLEMQTTGLRIDEGKREEMKQVLWEKIAEAQSKLNVLAGWEVNVNSPKQLQKFLYEQLRLPIKISRYSGRITTDDAALEVLASKHDSPAFGYIKAIRTCRKLVGTYMEAEADDDGRMRFSIKQTGTETGRLSVTKTIFGKGTNIQNWPEEARTAIIADEGKVLVAGDSSQAEAMIVAWLADETSQIERFKSGKKIHSLIGSRLYGVNEKKVVKGTKEYEIGKRCVHAGNYLIGPRKFAQITGLPVAEAEGKLLSYYEMFPGIKGWHDQVEQELRKTRILRTPFGRYRRFFGRWGDELIRKAIAYVPQSTCVDNVNRAMTRIYFLMYGQDVDTLIQVHDEVVWQCHPDRVAELIRTAKAEMERPFLCGAEMLSIPAEFKVGESWGDMKPYTLNSDTVQLGG